MSEENKEVLRRWVEEINKGSLALFDERYGDYAYNSPATGELKREARMQFLASVLAAFPDRRCDRWLACRTNERKCLLWAWVGGLDPVELLQGQRGLLGLLQGPVSTVQKIVGVALLGVQPGSLFQPGNG